MNEQMNIVTLDGPAGVGKTTIAMAAAKALGMVYMDTGAMFRAVALHLGPDALNWDDLALDQALTGISFFLDTSEGGGERTRLFCNGEALGEDIRTEEVGLLASKLAKRAPVRERLKIQQQMLGQCQPVVVEGRDMGTVVFPQARHKFFLDATPQVRAKRRYLQLQELDIPADFDMLTEQIRTRDEQDRTRDIAPLVPAPDAEIVDTSNLSIDQVLEHVVAVVRNANKGK